jgi:hypothetical protein
MWWERFRCYLEGGTPPGGSFTNRGARNSAKPERWEFVELPGRLYFAGYTKAWGGGGVAFIDPQATGSTFWGRAWLLERSQWIDIAAQENGLPADLTPDFPIEDVIATGELELDDLPSHNGICYRRLLYLGDRDDTPMLTFTAPRNYLGRSNLSAPSEEYLSTIIRGIREMKPEINSDSLADYLKASEGLGKMESEKLNHIIDTIIK